MPKCRVGANHFKTDGCCVERPQYFRLDNTGQERLEVTDVAFNTTAQVVGDDQQSMRLSHEKVLKMKIGLSHADNCQAAQQGIITPMSNAETSLHLYQRAVNADSHDSVSYTHLRAPTRQAEIS